MKKQASQLIALTITVLSLAVVAAPARSGLAQRRQPPL